MKKEEKANTATIVTHLNNPLDNKKATWSPEVVMRSIEMRYKKLSEIRSIFMPLKGLYKES